MRQVALREFCACRAGDKGDISDVTIFASRPEFFAVLQAELTTGRVLQFMAPIGPERIERFEVANLEAVKFVLYGALGGGGAASLRADNLGKNMGVTLLRLEVPVPDLLLPLIPYPRPPDFPFRE
jgi:hypothetical protein